MERRGFFFGAFRGVVAYRSGWDVLRCRWGNRGRREVVSKCKEWIEGGCVSFGAIFAVGGICFWGVVVLIVMGYSER